MVAYQQGEADSKEQVLKTLASGCQNFGRGWVSALEFSPKFDAPLEATTSSLEALKGYSLAVDEANRGKWLRVRPATRTSHSN